MPECRVVMLDDNAGAAEALGFMFEQLGAKPRAISDSDEFFEIVRLRPPDIICLDLVMPQIDGVEVIRRLSEQGCSAGIIITSGVESRVLDAARRAAIEHGLRVIGALPKPYSLSALKELLEKSDASSAAMSEDASSDQGGVHSEFELRNALEEREFRLAYQPKFTCSTRRVIGFEALARWHRGEGAVITPDAFLPGLEHFGLMTSFTRQVMEIALSWLAKLNREMSSPGQAYTIAINLSASALRSHEFVEEICVLCDRLDLESRLVTLELTETAAMEDPRHALALLTRLRMRGFHVAIDDFGTGYSSMAQLSRLPFDEIKIDKSFVLPALESRESRTIIKSTVDLGRSLGLRVVAEGVEEPETLEYLTSIGCDEAQGFLVAPPMPGEQVLEWLSAHTASSEEDGRGDG